MLLLYIIVFSLLLFYNYHKYGITPSTFIIAIYWVSAIASLVLMYGYDNFDSDKILLSAVLYHIVCLLLFLSPVIYFGNQDINTIRFPEFSTLRYLLWVIIILSLVSVSVSASKLGTAFSYDLDEARRLHNKNELYGDEPKDIFNYLGRLGSDLSFFSMFFFFYVVIKYPNKRIVPILLFISSLSIVISNLSIMGRDGIVRWSFFFITCFLLFKKNIPASIKRKIYIGTSVIFIPIITIFVMITQSRFSGRGEGPLYSVASYMGQSFIYFSYNFQQFAGGMSGGKIVFPILFSSSEKLSMNNLNDTFYADYNLNTFPTFVGSFYLDLGLVKTLALSILFFLTISFYFKLHRPHRSFLKLIFFLIFFQIMLLGVFYYMFYNETVINVYIAIVLLSLFIQVHSYFYNRTNPPLYQS